MAKPTVKKCICGRVSNPVTLNIVNDAWVKNFVAHFQFNCPQCRKKNVVKMIWNENLKLGPNILHGKQSYHRLSR